MSGKRLWLSGCSCDGNREMIGHVVVDGRPVAILGLELIFQELWALGERPETPALGPKLLKMVQTAWHDKPLEISEETFVQALLKEYADYLGQR